MRTEAATIAVCTAEALGLASTRVRGAKPSIIIHRERRMRRMAEKRAPRNPSGRRLHGTPGGGGVEGVQKPSKGGAIGVIRKTLHAVTAVVTRGTYIYDMICLCVVR